MLDRKSDLKLQAIRNGRESNISFVLFRNVIGSRLGLNVTDMECLDVLFFRGVATPSELAKCTGLSSGATTAMLDRLERSGLVERHPNPNDRRGTLIVIVKDAIEKVSPLFASVRKAQDKLMASYSEQELALLSGYFKKSQAMWEGERKKLLEGTNMR